MWIKSVFTNNGSQLHVVNELTNYLLLQITSCKGITCGDLKGEHLNRNRLWCSFADQDRTSPWLCSGRAAGRAPATTGGCHYKTGCYLDVGLQQHLLDKGAFWHEDFNSKSGNTFLSLLEPRVTLSPPENNEETEALHLSQSLYIIVY